MIYQKIRMNPHFLKARDTGIVWIKLEDVIKILEFMDYPETKLLVEQLKKHLTDNY